MPIVHDPEILGGDAIIEGTRMPVWAILNELRSNSIDEILADRTNLTRQDIEDALNYASDLLQGDITVSQEYRNAARNYIRSKRLHAWTEAQKLKPDTDAMWKSGFLDEIAICDEYLAEIYDMEQKANGTSDHQAT